MTIIMPTDEAGEHPVRQAKLESDDDHPKNVAETTGRHVTRDRPIDVLRGLNCFAMILVNTAASHRPNWLSHPASIDQPITFADTLFPCFLFTAGLASAQARNKQDEKFEQGKSSRLKRTINRAIKLNLIGIIYNNLIPRMTGFHEDGIEHLKTYRIPSVLGRIGISSLICSIESIFNIKPPILPACLGLIWHLISHLRPFEPLGSSSQAWLDQKLFGNSHLHNPIIGFDPEGLLASLSTVPISSLMATYLVRPDDYFVKLENSQLVAMAILGMLLTGLIPSPSCKLLWTPTYVGQTTSINLLYLAISRALVSQSKNQIISAISNKLQLIGQRSLEIYLISASCSYGLSKIGIWDSIFKFLNHSLIAIGIQHQDGTSKNLAGIIRSSILGFLMIPLSQVMIKFNWKL